MENNEIKTSKKRIIGSAVFGLVFGLYLNKAFEYTVPIILSIVKKISVEEGGNIYGNSIIFHFFLAIFIVFVAAGIAAFLARNKGILVGILANSITIILLGFLLFISIFDGQDTYIGIISTQLYSFLSLILIILASILGGYLGQKYYSPEIDPDSNKEKLTVFGIRWFHYFWVLPFIIYPTLTAVIIGIYTGFLVYLSDFYFLIHPSIWFNFVWWIYFFITPTLGMVAIYITVISFIEFWKIMQYGQIESRGWKKFWKILLFGVVVPSISFSIASIVATITHNMPQPSTGDWKIALGFALVIPIIYLFIYIFSWIKDKFSRKTDNL